MRQREHQSGFGTTVVLLAVLVVVVSAVTGLVLYQHHKSSSTKNSAAVSQTQTTTQPQNTTTTKPQNTTNTQPSQTTTQYLTITEWGVRAPYSGSDKLTYSLSSDKSTATIVSSQLSSASAECATHGAGSIIRYSPNDYASPYNTGPTIEQTATQNPGLYTHVGNYYYIFVHAQSACGNASVTAQGNANDTVKALVSNLQATAN